MTHPRIQYLFENHTYGPTLLLRSKCYILYISQVPVQTTTWWKTSVYSDAVAARFCTSINGIRTRGSEPADNPCLVNQFRGCTRVRVDAFRNRFRLSRSERSDDGPEIRCKHINPGRMTQSVSRRLDIHLWIRNQLCNWTLLLRQENSLSTGIDFRVEGAWNVWHAYWTNEIESLSKPICLSRFITRKNGRMSKILLFI